MKLQLYKDNTRSINFMGMPSGDFVDHIPPGAYNYKVVESMSGTAFKLEYIGESLPVPEVRYGEHAEMVRAVTDGYDRLNASYGILMFGRKGAGKTVLGNDIANAIGKGGVPTILVRERIHAQYIRVLIESIGPCVIYFDEFGKNYTSTEDREALLPIFSDMSNRGVVFIITGNEAEEFSSYFFDRPGRFKYKFTFENVSSAALLDYFKKNNIPANRLVWLQTVRPKMTFDILDAIKGPLRAAQSFHDFKNQLRWLNVPYPQSTMFSVTAVSVVEDGVYSPVEFVKGSCDGQKISVTAKCDDGTLVTEEFNFIQPNGFYVFAAGRPQLFGKLLIQMGESCVDYDANHMTECGVFATRVVGRERVQHRPYNIDAESETPFDPFVQYQKAPAKKSAEEASNSTGRTLTFQLGAENHRPAG